MFRVFKINFPSLTFWVVTTHAHFGPVDSRADDGDFK